MCIHVYMCIFIDMCVCVCVCVCIHTHLLKGEGIEVLAVLLGEAVKDLKGLSLRQRA
jgi:hypothetical protein